MVISIQRESLKYIPFLNKPEETIFLRPNKDTKYISLWNVRIFFTFPLVVIETIFLFRIRKQIDNSPR